MFQIEPILLNHERPITQIKYNREGDLLWTASKKKTINVWYSSNGERVGTYDGHNGAVFSLDVDKRTEKIVSGSGDSTTRIWSAESGIEIARWHNGVPVRCVEFSANATQILTLGAQVMGSKSRISLWDTSSCSNNAISEMQNGDNIRITCAYFNPSNECVVTGNEDGTVRLFDLKNPSAPIEVVKVHEKEITQLSYSKDRVFLISASRDGKAKLLDASSFKCLKTYETGIPINSAAISPHPHKEEVAVGGGQEVASVALMGPPDKNQFAVRFFHSVYEEYIGRMAGHFGPLTYLAYHPDGSQLATGGEDGLVRVHTFPEKYFTSFKIKDDPNVLLH